MTLEELRQKMEVCMGKFLDFSMSPTPKHERFYVHLEELKEELNDLMGQFIEANELVRTNEMGGWVEEFRKALPPEGTYESHRIKNFPEYIDKSGEIGASEIEMFKTEIEKVTEDFELEERKATTLVNPTNSNKEGEEI